jgi:hypothetical protein
MRVMGVRVSRAAEQGYSSRACEAGGERDQ